MRRKDIMNNNYKYFEQSLTPNIAKELIQELFAGQTATRQEIVKAVDEEHLARGGRLSIARVHHPVSLALSSMKRLGHAEDVRVGVWSFPPKTENSEEGKSERSEITEVTEFRTLDEFIGWVEQLAPEEYLFRGVPNIKHDIEASAYRRLKNEEDQNFDKFLEINRELIKNARLRGHDQQNGRELSDLELLAELQHFRAATCLVDFTYNALIALWFACQPSSNGMVNGKVVAVRNNPARFKEITPKLLKKEIDYFFEDSEGERFQMYQWQPRFQNYRIIAQQSIFLFGHYKFDEDAKCIIVADSKQDILTALQHVSGITEAMLFPDFVGFSRLRSHHVPYMQLSASDYAERGARAHQRNEYEAALADYDMAIQLNPDNAQVFYNRGLVGMELKRYPDALADFNKVIELNPNNANAYNNRGNVQVKLEQYEEALNDYDAAIRLNPDHAAAYYHRGDVKVKLGNLNLASEDLHQALQLAAQIGDANLIVRIGELLQEIEARTEV